MKITQRIFCKAVRLFSVLLWTLLTETTAEPLQDRGGMEAVADAAVSTNLHLPGSDSNRKKAATRSRYSQSQRPVREQPNLSWSGEEDVSNKGWPSGSGYRKKPARRPVLPHKVTISTTVATIVGLSDEGLELKGSVDAKIDAVTGTQQLLVIHPGSVLTVQCKDSPSVEVKDYNGDVCSIPNGTSVRVDEYGQFVPVQNDTRNAHIGTPGDERPDVAGTTSSSASAQLSSSRASPDKALIFSSSYWTVECDSIQFATVQNKKEVNTKIELRGELPGPVIAAILTCRFIGEYPKELLGSGVEVPSVSIPGKGVCEYEGFQGEVLDQQLSSPPIWMTVEDKAKSREIMVGSFLTGQLKLPRNSKVRLTIAYRLPSSAAFRPDGKVEIRTTQGAFWRSFPSGAQGVSATCSSGAEASTTVSVDKVREKAMDESGLDAFDKIREGDTKDRVQQILGYGSSLTAGQIEVLLYPTGTIRMKDGRVTFKERKKAEVKKPLSPADRFEHAANMRQGHKPPSQTASAKERESAALIASRELLPVSWTPLIGLNEVRIRNPNPFSVVVGLRKEKMGPNFKYGRDFEVPANGVKSVQVATGKYCIFFVYSNEPTSMYQGDDFTLSGFNGIEIRIEAVKNGNYGIRKVQ